MPILSVTTTAIDVFSGDNYLESITFANGSLAGTIYIRNRRLTNTEVASSSYEFSLAPGDTLTYMKAEDGDSVKGPFRAISDTAGGVTLEINPSYNKDRRS